MAFTLRDSQRLKKEDEFVRLLKGAARVRNDFFFVLFEERPARQPLRRLG